MGKKGGKGKNVENAGGDEVAEIQTEENEPEAGTEGEGEGEAPIQSEVGPKKQKKKGKKFDPLSDDPIKFAKIGFENALTPEEKAANKAAKKGGKKKKEKPPPVEKPQEPKVETAKAEEEPRAGADATPEEKPKKEKKGKKGKGGKEEASKPQAEASKPQTEASKPQAEASTEKKKGKKSKSPPADTAEKTESEGEAKSKKQKGKKGKKAGDQETSEADAEGNIRKGKKGKVKKDKPEGEEGVEGVEVPELKGKKGKGKKGKGKKGLKPESSKQGTKVSISAFLERYASMQRDDDEWTWESYSASSESIKEVPKKGKKGKGKGKGKKGKKGKQEEKVGELPEGDITPATEEKGGKKGKGKGKKGKKGKQKEDVAKPDEDVSSATDIMAEINKMKAMAEAQALAEFNVAEETAAVEPKKKKKGKTKKEKGDQPAGPKKKLSKKERAKLAAELAEQARIQAELDAIREAEEERIRLIEERKAAIEKEKREISEQFIRTEQLNNSINVINLIKQNKMKKDLKDRDHRQWEQFIKCDGLPDPYVCGELNTYLHLWDTVMESTTIDDAAVKTTEVLKLLDLITTVIDDPTGIEQSQIDNWKWVHRLFREHQQESIDTATYRLMRNIGKNMHYKNFYEADFQRKEEAFSLNLWLLRRLPKSKPNPKRPPPVRIQMDVPDMQMNVLFPTSLECRCMAIRAMYLKYDHLSDLCASFEKPPVPEEYEIDLYNVTLKEWYSKLYYKYENRLLPEGNEPSQDKEEPVVDKEKGIIPFVPYQKLEPTASGYFNEEEDKMYLQIRDNLVTTVDEHVINLRKYVILGGTYCLNLYYQPPQPQEIFTFYITITRLEIPKCLSDVAFYIKYDPPDPTLAVGLEKTEEQITQEQEELDQLLLFTVTLPDHVLWLDVPTVCYWDEQRQLWTTEDVHDLKHCEDENYLTFRSGRFGCFAFAVYRYTNLPYQAWELKPEVDGSVTLQITAAILLIEFNVKGDLISVSEFQNSSNKALQNIIGIYYKLPRLIRILQEVGVDIFPAFDSFCYIEGTCEKHWPVEKHTYYNMAQLSGCYNFTWSRWNLTAGRRNIVMQMRLYKPEKDTQLPHSTLLVTPLNASFIECTEDSEEFIDQSVEGMHFYSDLYNLMKGTTTMTVRSKVQNTSSALVSAVAELLIATRIVSFS